MNAQYGFSSIPPPAKKTRPQNNLDYVEKIAKRKEELAAMKQRIGIRLNEPIVGNLAPYRGGTAVHRNPVTVAAGGSVSTGIVRPIVRSGGLNGVKPTKSVVPPPAYLATSAGTRAGTIGPPPMVKHGGLLSSSSPSNIPRYSNREAAAMPSNPAPVRIPPSRKQSGIPPPPTPNTIRRAEEALSEEKPVNSKKEMIYLMNTYGHANVNVNASTESMQPKATVYKNSAVGSNGVSKPVISSHTNSASTNSISIGTNQPPQGSHIVTKEMKVGESSQELELKLLKMLNQEKESRTEALEKLAKGSKNYKMFALLFSKIINKNLNATQSKVFAKIRENVQQKRGASILKSLEEIPKFEMALNQHVTQLGTYTIRTADMSKLYKPEIDDDSYKAAFIATDSTSISVRAKVSMDDSLAILVGGQVYHSFDEANWSLNVTGKVGYINDFGDEGEYDFDQVTREMLAVRRAFLERLDRPYQHMNGEAKPVEKKIEMDTSTKSLNALAPPHVVLAYQNIPAPSVRAASLDQARPIIVVNNGFMPPPIGQFPMQPQQTQQKNHNVRPLQQSRLSPPMPTQSRPVIVNRSEAPAFQTAPAQSKPIMADSTQSPAQMARKMPENSDVQQEATTLPPPINRISPHIKPLDGSVDVKLPPLKKATTSVEEKELVSEMKKATSAPGAAVLVKQPRITVEHLEIRPPPNPFIALLFLPSRMMLQMFRKFLSNMILFGGIIALWVYFSEAPTLLWTSIIVPSVMGGPSGYIGSLSMPEIPEEVESTIRDVWKVLQDLL